MCQVLALFPERTGPQLPERHVTSPGSLGSQGPGYLTPPAISHLHHLSPLASSSGKNKNQKREFWRSLLPEGFKDAGCQEWGNPEKSTSAQLRAHSRGAETQMRLRTQRPPSVGQSQGHGPPGHPVWVRAEHTAPKTTQHGPEPRMPVPETTQRRPEPRTWWGVAPGPSLHCPAPAACPLLAAQAGQLRSTECLQPQQAELGSDVGRLGLVVTPASSPGQLSCWTARPSST